MDMIGIQYNAKLQRMVRQIKRDIDRKIVPLVRSLASQYVQDADAPHTAVTLDAWSDIILGAMASLRERWTSNRVNTGAQRIAGDFVQSALKKSERDLKKSAGIDVFSGSTVMQDYLKASAQQNVQLIQSIPARYLEEVETLLIANMRSGMRPGYIVSALVDQYGITQRRAKFIARDQTGKIQGEINERQQRSAGFDYFRWLDSDDRRVRDRHRKIAEKVTAYGPGVYRWDNLPLSQDGVPIRPGQDYNCRCTAVPVSSAQVEQYRKSGQTKPGVYR